MDSEKSPFFDKPVLAQNEHAFAITDGFPVTEGHTLVVSRRVVASYFDLREEEQAALWGLVNLVKQMLDEGVHPDGYNIGINVGAAAGQTVPHVHVHVIPRRIGDHPNPRGGVRAVIPGKESYDAERAQTGNP